MGTSEQSPKPSLDVLNSISSGLLHIYASQTLTNPDRVGCSVRCVSYRMIVFAYFFLFFLFLLLMVWLLRGRSEDSGKSDDLSCVNRKDTAARWHRAYCGGRNRPPFVSSSATLAIDILFEKNHSLLPIKFQLFPLLVMKSWHSAALILSTFYYPHASLFEFMFAINKSVCACMRACVDECLCV